MSFYKVINMGRKKPSKRSFSPTSRKRCKQWNVDHSWFALEDSIHAIDSTNMSDTESEELPGACGKNIKIEPDLSNMSDTESEEFAGASGKKIKIEADSASNKDSLYVMLSCELLQESFRSVAPICSNCREGNLSIKVKEQDGIAVDIVYLCTNGSCPRYSEMVENAFPMSEKDSHKHG